MYHLHYKQMVLVGNIKKLKSFSETVAIFSADLLIIFAMFTLSVFIRVNILPFLYTGFPRELTFAGVIDIWWVFPVWIFFCSYEGLYTRRFPFWDEVRAIWKVSFFSTVGIFVVISVGKLQGEISRTVIVLMGVLAAIAFPIARIGLKSMFRKIGFFRRRVLILGAGETGKLISHALKREPNFGYELIGFLDDDPEKVGKRIDGIKIHRGVDRALQYVTRCGADDVFIAMPGAGKERLQGLINHLQHKVGRILFVPDIFGIAVLGTSLKHFFHEEVLAFEIENNLSNPVNVFVKKIFDLTVSLVLIPLLAAPMICISFLIRMDSRGPAIFTQDRIGKGGRLFKCFKFRSMYSDAEERLAEIVRKDPVAQSEWEERWKLKDDPRVTRVGRFLRMTSLDELPQIFNVLMGEMSLVGPRPYLPREEKYMTEQKQTILLTKPGITGLWQVSGRSDTGYGFRIALDSWYVRNWNLWLDIVILLKTIRIVIKMEGAY